MPPTSPTSPVILYDQGSNAVFAQSLFFIVALCLITGAIMGVLLWKQRSQTLAPEWKWVLISAAVLMGVTTVLFTLSALPDMLQTPRVDTGRINKIFERRKAAAEAPITYISLSTGVELQIPKGMVKSIEDKAGTCLQVTRTAATGYVLIAKQLPMEACINP
jgi:hypothetical protein